MSDAAVTAKAAGVGPGAAVHGDEGAPTPLDYPPVAAGPHDEQEVDVKAVVRDKKGSNDGVNEDTAYKDARQRHMDAMKKSDEVTAKLFKAQEALNTAVVDAAQAKRQVRDTEKEVAKEARCSERQ